MIKVGIYGSATVNDPVRKQLLRLLLRHPDVDLRAVASPAGNTMPLSTLHPVYTGETELTLERVLNMDKLDVLFVIDDENLTPEIMERYNSDPDFKLIVLGKTSRLINKTDNTDFIYGLPELNRKPLVRGARAAVAPEPEAILLELAMLPLAKNALLNSDISVEISAPGDRLQYAADEAARIFTLVQPSFNGKITCTALPPAPFDRLDMHIQLQTPIAIEEIERIYNEFYDDHNFTYIVEGDGAIDEDLRGSNKCLLRLNRNEGLLSINASMDYLTKGITGNAVHIMNLLFGLYERTGLSI